MLGADEHQPFFFHPFGERFIFGKKTVAWMDGLGAGLLGRRDDLVGHQIRLTRGRRAQQYSLIGHLYVARFAVCLGIDCHSGNAHFLGRRDDPASDLAAVSNQDFGEHDGVP